ncbi:hypothetical protein D018_4773B, partial [Vibrio parahaemolyticus VP2007-007]
LGPILGRNNHFLGQTENGRDRLLARLWQSPPRQHFYRKSGKSGRNRPPLLGHASYCAPDNYELPPNMKPFGF